VCINQADVKTASIAIEEVARQMPFP